MSRRKDLLASAAWSFVAVPEARDPWGPAVIPDPAEWQRLAYANIVGGSYGFVTPRRDAQLMESRSFQREEIAAWFGVDPAIVQDATTSTTADWPALDPWSVHKLMYGDGAAKPLGFFGMDYGAEADLWAIVHHGRTQARVVEMSEALWRGLESRVKENYAYIVDTTLPGCPRSFMGLEVVVLEDVPDGYVALVFPDGRRQPL